MKLENIVVVLDRPEESRNIGAMCRAMANSAIHTLRIVGTKREDIDAEHVHVLAIHAGHIFDSAQYFASITEAVADCACAAATTRRPGKKRKNALMLPEEFAAFADSLTESAARAGTDSTAGSAGSGSRVAVVFGNERTGLSDSEIQECSAGVTIPTSEEFGSLNLSHAVQLVCYQLFRRKIDGEAGRAALQDAKTAGYTPLTLPEVDALVTYLLDDMRSIGFFSHAGRPEMEQFWKGVLARAALSGEQADFMRKTFDRMVGLCTRAPLNHPA